MMYQMCSLRIPPMPSLATLPYLVCRPPQSFVLQLQTTEESPRGVHVIARSLDVLTDEMLD